MSLWRSCGPVFFITLPEFINVCGHSVMHSSLNIIHSILVRLKSGLWLVHCSTFMLLVEIFVLICCCFRSISEVFQNSHDAAVSSFRDKRFSFADPSWNLRFKSSVEAEMYLLSFLKLLWALHSLSLRWICRNIPFWEDCIFVLIHAWMLQVTKLPKFLPL